MKNIYRAVLLGAVMATIGACATVYTDEQFATYQAEHKRVAILPFTVSIDTKNLPKASDLESIQSSQKDEGYLFQQQLATQYLNRQQKGRYTVTFQPVDETNILLKRAGIVYSNLSDFTKSEIGTILGVDSVISGTIKRSKPMGTGAAVASTFLVGVGVTNKVTVNMSLHDSTTGNLLWSYDHQQNGGLGSSPDRLSKNLMKNSASKFPYRKSS